MSLSTNPSHIQKNGDEFLWVSTFNVSLVFNMSQGTTLLCHHFAIDINAEVHSNLSLESAVCEYTSVHRYHLSTRFLDNMFD